MRKSIGIVLAWLAALLLLAAPAAAHPPWGIVIAPDGSVYFSDLETVWRIATDGRLSIFRPRVDAHIHELALAPNGDHIWRHTEY